MSSSGRFPVGIFPDGDADAPLPRRSPLAPGLGRSLALQAVASVILLVLFARVLGTLRSEALGFLFVPAFLVLVGAFGQRMAPVFTAQDADDAAVFELRTGMTWTPSSSVTDDAQHPAGDAALRAAGFRASSLQEFATGRLWDAGPSDARIGDATYGSGKSSDTWTVAAVPLAAPVAARYLGMSLTFGSRIGDLLSNVEVRLAHWQLVSMERIDTQSGVRVRRTSEQDELAVWELFDPAFLVALEERATQFADDQLGFVVTGGSLFAWMRGQLVGRAPTLLRATERGPVGLDELDRLGRMLDATRLLATHLDRAGR